MAKSILFRREQYKIIIERDEDGFFVASVPALPGCHTQAKTYDELLRRVRDAIMLCTSTAHHNRRYRERVRRFAYEPSFVGMEVVKV